MIIKTLKMRARKRN
ncbi:TPA: hypothetical protein RMT55_002878 [Escherichia coli]|nr:hypothetical protein [Escherichia coli]